MKEDRPPREETAADRALGWGCLLAMVAAIAWPIIKLIQWINTIH